jgi:hypothetical protein
VVERHEVVVSAKHQNLSRTCHVHEVVLELLDRVSAPSGYGTAIGRLQYRLHTGRNNGCVTGA